MKIKQLCQNCGSEWETDEPNKVYDEISRSWVDTQPEICTDCIKDLGYEEN